MQEEKDLNEEATRLRLQQEQEKEEHNQRRAEQDNEEEPPINPESKLRGIGNFPPKNGRCASCEGKKLWVRDILKRRCRQGNKR
jgi:hypothetical protein